MRYICGVFLFLFTFFCLLCTIVQYVSVVMFIIQILYVCEGLYSHVFINYTTVTFVTTHCIITLLNFYLDFTYIRWIDWYTFVYT